MTNDELESEIIAEIGRERASGTRLLHLINLAETQLLYAERGFDSVFLWLTKGLGYSEPSAWRRVDSARLLLIVPDADAKLRTGELNLTNMAQAQTSIRAQEKKVRRKMTNAQKAEVVRVIEKKTADEAKVALFELLPESASEINREQIKRTNVDQHRVSLNFSNEDVENLAWIRDFLSHAMPEATNGEILSRLMSEFRLKQAKSKAVVKRAKRDHRSCKYKDEKTGRTCGSTFRIEVDHIVPKALGGTDDPSNLRCLCRKHNQLMAEHWLGRAWSRAWRRMRDAARAASAEKDAATKHDATGPRGSPAASEASSAEGNRTRDGTGSVRTSG